MHHTPQIKKAIQFAAQKHEGQYRKNAEPLPYITHLFSVALFAAEGGADEDTLTAALLHDTIEDTGTTREELATVFNTHVADLVEAVSERKEVDGRSLSWRERKQDYLDRLQAAEEGALLIAASDKIDNIEDRINEYEQEGEAFLQHFSQPNSEYLWFHGGVLAIAQARLPEHALTERLAETHARQLALFAT